MNFKIGESYDDLKRIRAQEIQDASKNDEDNRFKTLFQLGLTKEQIDETDQIVEDILCEDPEVSRRAMIDFFSQIQHLSHRIVTFLSFFHIQKMIECLDDPYFTEPSLQILSAISEDQHINTEHDLLIFLNYAELLMNQPNNDFISYAINIIGNNSRKNSKFRDLAFEKKFFHIMGKCNADPKEIANALESALECDEYGDLPIEEEISKILIELSENSDGTYRHHAIKAFYYLELNEHTDFHHVIVDNLYINVLTDVIINNEKPKYTKMAFAIISGCCICGDDCLKQIFDFDTINFFCEIINPTDRFLEDEYMESFINFLVNSLVSNCDDMYNLRLVEIFCNKDLQNIFKNHSISVYVKGSNAIQRLLYITEDPKVLADALTPCLIESLADLLFLSDVIRIDSADCIINVLNTFDYIVSKLLTDETVNFTFLNVLHLLSDIVHSDEYDKLLLEDNFDEDDPVLEKLVAFKQNIEDLLPEDENEE